ncbi:hypothetical protein Hanom_Chr17g01530041 [Helianthus anomalus]
MFGAATCPVPYHTNMNHIKVNSFGSSLMGGIKLTFAIARAPRAFLFPNRSSWSAASNTNSRVFSNSILHCIEIISTCK